MFRHNTLTRQGGAGASRASRTRGQRRAGFLSVLAGSGILAAAMLAAPLVAGAAGSAMAQQAPRKVVAQAPVAARITRHLHSTGRFQPVSGVDLVARVSGTLERVNFPDGAPVRAGDVVFVIEQEPYRIGVASAQADLAQARANLVQASANLARQKELAGRQVVSASTLDSAVAQNDTASAQVAAAEAAVRSAELNLGYTEIRAPFDGILSARTADVGAYINAASAPKLASLVQPDPLYVLFSADEQQVIAIRKALAERQKTLADMGSIAVEIGVQTETGYPHAGRLDYVAPEFDSNTGTIAVRGVIPNPDRLFVPGMFARVRVPFGEHDALTVPDTAIGNAQQGRVVLVLGADNRVEQRRVVPGELTDNGMREIVDGLAAGDRVIVRGGGGLRSGEAVTPVDSL